MALRKFIIERDILGAGTLEREQLRAAAAKSNEVLRQLGPDIQWVDSYVAADRRLPTPPTRARETRTTYGDNQAAERAARRWTVGQDAQPRHTHARANRFAEDRQ